MLSINKNYTIIMVLLLIVLYLDGFGCTTKDSGIVQPGENTASAGMPDKCQNILDIKHEDNFEVIQTPSGVEIEVLYSFWNSKSILIAPYTGMSAKSFRILSNELFSRGINTFTMSYYNTGGSKKINWFHVDSKTYQDNFADAKNEIERKYYSTKNLMLVGYSRGGRVVQNYLAIAEKPMKAVLIGSNFSVRDKSSNKYVCSMKDEEWYSYLTSYGPNNQMRWRDPNYTLEKYFWDRKMSAQSIKPNVNECMFSLMEPIPISIYDKISIDYSSYRFPHVIRVIVNKKDTTRFPHYQKSCAKALKKYTKNVEVVEMDGGHLAPLVNVKTSADLILGVINQ